MRLEDFVKKDGKKILLVERGSDARYVVENADIFRTQIPTENIIIVADSPGAMYEFDKAKINYVLPEKYYSPEENFAFTTSLKGKVLGFLNAFDKELQSLVPAINEGNLTPALFHCHQFVIIINALANHYFKLNKIIDSEKTNIIAVFNPGQQGLITETDLQTSFIWKNEENLYYEILKRIKKDCCDVHIIKPDNRDVEKDKTFSKRGIIAPFLKSLKRILLKKFPHIASVLMPLSLFGLFYFLKNNKSVLHIGGLYGWKYSVKQLKKHKIIISGVLYDNSVQFRNKETENFKDVFEKIKENESIRKFCLLKDIDLFPIIESRVKYFVEQVVPNSIVAYKYMRKYISRKKIGAVLFSVISSAISKSLCHAARAEKVPVIGWHHGPYHIKDTIFSIDYDDFLVSDCFFTFGNGTVRLCKENADLLGSKLLPIGSAMLDFAKKANKPKMSFVNRILDLNVLNNHSKIILYALSPYYLNKQYNATFPPFSSNLLYETHKKMIEGLSAIRFSTKIIKLHPAVETNVPELRMFIEEQNDKSVKIVFNEISLIDILPYVSCIVVDQPQTVVIQAIAAGLPVFALLNHLKLDDYTEGLLRKRVVCSYSPEELLSSIKKFVELNVYEADINDDQYLREYGTYLNDGKSAERAAEILSKYILER